MPHVFVLMSLYQVKVCMTCVIFAVRQYLITNDEVPGQRLMPFLGQLKVAVRAPDVRLGPSDEFWRRWGDPRPLEQLSFTPLWSHIASGLSDLLVAG
jgi:hypothetical protein